MSAGLLVEDKDLVLEGCSHKVCILFPPLQAQTARRQALGLKDARWQTGFHIGLTKERKMSTLESNINSSQLRQRKSSPVFPWAKRQVGGHGGRVAAEVRTHRGSRTHFHPLAFCLIFQRQLCRGRLASTGGLHQCGQQQHRYQSL